MTLQAPVPSYIVVGRIVAVVGLSLAIALAIFLLLGGKLVWAAIALAAAVPFGGMIFLIERAPGGSSGDGHRAATPDDNDEAGSSG